MGLEALTSIKYIIYGDGQIKRMIKWIFFDVGSTLVDESKAWEKRVSDTVKGAT